MRRCPRAPLALALLAAACGDKEEPGFEIPAPPPVGYQVQLQPVVIQPGQDLEYCSYFNLDLPEDLVAAGEPVLVKDLIANGIDPRAEEVAIGRIDVRGAPGLHHIQVLAIENDTEDVPDKHIFECAVDLFGGPLTGDVEPLFFTSLNDYSVSYEPGVARILKRVVDRAFVRTSSTSTGSVVLPNAKRRGAQLLYNFHYLNTTAQPITAEVVVNLHVVPRESVVHPVRSAWWNFVYFEATAGQPSSAEAKGSFNVDVNLVNMTSHLHETGTRFTFRRDDGAQIYESTDWAEPSYLRFPEGQRLAKGEPIHFRCEWNNTFVASRYFGLQADDEMCTAIIEYYPVDEAEAEAYLEMKRRENGMRQGPFMGSAVSLERFFGFPEEVIDMLVAEPARAEEILDKDIICGIALNLKQMERQYGRSSELLASLQVVLEYLSPWCNLD